MQNMLGLEKLREIRFGVFVRTICIYHHPRCTSAGRRAAAAAAAAAARRGHADRHGCQYVALIAVLLATHRCITQPTSGCQTLQAMLAARRQALCAAQEGLGALYQALQSQTFAARPTGRPRATPAARPPPPPPAAAAAAEGTPSQLQQAQQDQLVTQEDDWLEVIDRNTK